MASVNSASALDLVQQALNKTAQHIQQSHSSKVTDWKATSYDPTTGIVSTSAMNQPSAQYYYETGQPVNTYNNFIHDYSSLADAILKSANLNDPAQYLKSAWDIANLNTQTSQALAREQMAFQQEANAKAMAFSASEAQKTRDWEQLLSDTAHQREVKDLLSAGLNPILSANQGASTPTVANAQGVTSSGAKGSVDTSMVQAMMNVYQQAMALKLQDKQIDAQLLMNKVNNETTRYAADRAAYGTVTAAGLNSSASRYASDVNRSLYEQGYHGMSSMVGNLFASSESLLRDLLGSSDPSAAVVKMLKDQFPWMSKYLPEVKPFVVDSWKFDSGARSGGGRTTNSGDFSGRSTK